MKKVLIVAVTLVFAAALSVRATAHQQSTPPAQNPKPEQKPDAKAPPTVAGKWDGSIDSDQGAMQVFIEIKLDGKKVSGTISGPQGQYPIEGEYADNKLNFYVSVDGGGGSMQVTFTGALKDDGSLAGTLDFGQGAVPWHATRSKS
jgi:hypothetical protein